MKHVNGHVKTYLASYRASVAAMQTKTGRIRIQVPKSTPVYYVRFKAKQLVERSIGPGVDVIIPLVEEVYFE